MIVTKCRITIIKTNGNGITEKKMVNAYWANHNADRIEIAETGCFYYVFILHYSGGDVVEKEYGNKGDIKLAGHF